MVQRCVIIQKDEKGYGLTVSGDNPVFVQSVKEGEIFCNWIIKKKKNELNLVRKSKNKKSTLYNYFWKLFCFCWVYEPYRVITVAWYKAFNKMKNDQNYIT